MRKLYCRFFGHNWVFPAGFKYTQPILCGRCGYDMDYAGTARRLYSEWLEE